MARPGGQAEAVVVDSDGSDIDDLLDEAMMLEALRQAEKKTAFEPSSHVSAHMSSATASASAIDLGTNHAGSTKGKTVAQHMRQTTLSFAPKSSGSAAASLAIHSKRPSGHKAAAPDNGPLHFSGALCSTCAIGGGRDAEGLPSLDSAMADSWVFPTNFPERSYQLSIIKRCLAENTLVTLPTGLGKTFIAAVLMYNFYRWYPNGKVIFMAPTKPLVTQQLQACQNIMGFDPIDICELSGAKSPERRRALWQRCRVFFLTPQVIQNDLNRGTCPGRDVVCVVVDEAHRATGNHAYCNVVSSIGAVTDKFRIIALSATPGDDIATVQQVIGNLRISAIEIRSETSADIQPYTNDRQVQQIVVPDGPLISKYLEIMYKFMSKFLTRLHSHGAIYTKDPSRIKSFLLIQQRTSFRQRSQDMPQGMRGQVENDFAICMSLSHICNLLKQHGVTPFYTALRSYTTGGEKEKGSTKRVGKELMGNATTAKMLKELDQLMTEAESDGIIFKGHPKLEKLEDIVVSHFQQTDLDDTRVMIFSSYRDSVADIVNVLSAHSPTVRVACFVGQSTGKEKRGLKQKEQLEVINKFRRGFYNTIVATSVGEEGLDIGDVDLIVCYDAQGSSTRLIQRMGRTGRKRKGRIVQLLSAGVEENTYKRNQASKNSIHKAIMAGSKKFQLFGDNARMIPAQFSPTIRRVKITPATGMAFGEAPTGPGDVAGGPDDRTDGGRQGSGITSAAGRASKRGRRRKGRFSLDPTEAAEFETRFELGKASQAALPSQMHLSQHLELQSVPDSTLGVCHSTRTLAFVRTLNFAQLLESDPSELTRFRSLMEVNLNMDDVETAPLRHAADGNATSSHRTGKRRGSRGSRNVRSRAGRLLDHDSSSSSSDDSDERDKDGFAQRSKHKTDAVRLNLQVNLTSTSESERDPLAGITDTDSDPLPSAFGPSKADTRTPKKKKKKSRRTSHDKHNQSSMHKHKQRDLEGIEAQRLASVSHSAQKRRVRQPLLVLDDSDDDQERSFEKQQRDARLANRSEDDDDEDVSDSEAQRAQRIASPSTLLQGRSKPEKSNTTDKKKQRKSGTDGEGGMLRRRLRRQDGSRRSTSSESDNGDGSRMNDDHRSLHRTKGTSDKSGTGDALNFSDERAEAQMDSDSSDGDSERIKELATLRRSRKNYPQKRAHPLCQQGDASEHESHSTDGDSIGVDHFDGGAHGVEAIHVGGGMLGFDDANGETNGVTSSTVSDKHVGLTGVALVRHLLPKLHNTAPKRAAKMDKGHAGESKLIELVQNAQRSIRMNHLKSALCITKRPKQSDLALVMPSAKDSLSFESPTTTAVGSKAQSGLQVNAPPSKSSSSGLRSKVQTEGDSEVRATISTALHQTQPVQQKEEVQSRMLIEALLADTDSDDERAVQQPLETSATSTTQQRSPQRSPRKAKPIVMPTSSSEFEEGHALTATKQSGGQTIEGASSKCLSFKSTPQPPGLPAEAPTQTRQHTPLDAASPSPVAAVRAMSHAAQQQPALSVLLSSASPSPIVARTRKRQGADLLCTQVSPSFAEASPSRAQVLPQHQGVGTDSDSTVSPSPKQKLLRRPGRVQPPAGATTAAAKQRLPSRGVQGSPDSARDGPSAKATSRPTGIGAKRHESTRSRGGHSKAAKVFFDHCVDEDEEDDYADFASQLGGSQNQYDFNDSFLDDGTQANRTSSCDTTPSQQAGGRDRTRLRGKLSSQEMMHVYRKSLLSPEENPVFQHPKRASGTARLRLQEVVDRVAAEAIARGNQDIVDEQDEDDYEDDDDLQDLDGFESAHTGRRHDPSTMVHNGVGGDSLDAAESDDSVFQLLDMGEDDSLEAALNQRRHASGPTPLSVKSATAKATSTVKPITASKRGARGVGGTGRSRAKALQVSSQEQKEIAAVNEICLEDLFSDDEDADADFVVEVHSANPAPAPVSSPSKEYEQLLNHKEHAEPQRTKPTVERNQGFESSHGVTVSAPSHTTLLQSPDVSQRRSKYFSDKPNSTHDTIHAAPAVVRSLSTTKIAKQVTGLDASSASGTAVASVAEGAGEHEGAAVQHASLPKSKQAQDLLEVFRQRTHKGSAGKLSDSTNACAASADVDEEELRQKQQKEQAERCYAKRDDDICIFADTRQLQTCGQLFSYLRETHKVQVQVISLEGPSYVVSPRMAVLKLTQDDVVSWHSKPALRTSIQSAVANYDRFYVLVEASQPRSAGPKKQKAVDEATLMCTPHPFVGNQPYHSGIARLIQAKAKVVTTRTHHETAKFLSDLTFGEFRKGVAFSQRFCQAPLSQHTQQMMSALCKLTGFPPVTVRLVHASGRFKTWAEIFQSNARTIQDVLGPNIKSFRGFEWNVALSHKFK
eukprot:m.345279 g.345279  ORF g.345279 m.345279 type:complete len:2355 (+) comp16140_c0_seq2:190-7254(+)